MNIHVLMKFSTVLLAFVLCGCDSEADRLDRAKRAVRTATYNYTQFNLYDIRFSDEDNKLEKYYGGYAPAVLRGSPQQSIGGGVRFSWEADSCCFLLSKDKQASRTIRVIWNVIFDNTAYSQRGSYDVTTATGPPPGSAWCEAIIEVPPPSGSPPFIANFHFFPDGTVRAIVSSGDFSRASVLPAAEVKKHNQPKLCAKQISNPWYGIPLQPHRE